MSEAQVVDFDAEASFLVGIHSHGNVKISALWTVTPVFQQFPVHSNCKH